VVSYNSKHNEANGEENRDGSDNSLSWNCGAEGPSDDPAIERLRNRQVKNFLTLTLLSIGTPMLLMGDEVRRTQRGNNNAYCQNNVTTWFDWQLLARHADVHRFVKHLIALRLTRSKERFSATLSELLRKEPFRWHGIRLEAPDWSRESHTLAVTAYFDEDQHRLHLMINAYWQALDFEIPRVAYGPWRRCIDTFLDAPDDIEQWANAPQVRAATYPVQARSVVMLVATSTGRDAGATAPSPSQRGEAAVGLGAP
jgi:isoamylase